MATHRSVHLSFWTDPKIEDDFTPEERYFFLYLLTNPHTNICGCYEISTRAISRETGYTDDIVSRLLERMEQTHNVIKYCRDTKEILILNWSRYNWTTSDKLSKAVKEQAGYIKNEQFRDYVLSKLVDEKHPIDTVPILSQYPIETSDTESVSDTVFDNKVDPDFNKFWNSYPRKVGKKDAIKAFKKIKGVTIDDLITAIERLSESDQWQQDGGRYIPNPATWLNRGGWEDEPANYKHNIKQGKTHIADDPPQKGVDHY